MIKSAKARFSCLTRLWALGKTAADVLIYNAWAARKLLKKIKRDGKFIPKIIYLETTNICNACCIMCPHEKMKRQPGIMPWEIFEKIIGECREFGRGLEFFLHKDGEPLNDPLLFRRIKYIKDALPDASVCFNSNAMLLDEEKARLLLGSGINKVVFSVDAAKEKTYERIRPGLKYDTVKNNLDIFFALKKASRVKIKAGMQMVVNKDNRGEIGQYRRQWQGKADFLVFKPMHNFLDTAMSARTKKLGKKQKYFCIQPFDMLMVYWNGDIGLCCWDYDRFCDLGNARQNRIIDIYNNAEFKKIRTAMCIKECKGLIPCNRCSRIYGQDIWP